MTFISAPAAQCVISWQGLNGTWANVLHFGPLEFAVSGDDAADFFLGLQAGFDAAPVDMFDGDVQVLGATLRGLVEEGEETFNSGPITYSPSGSTNQLPNQVALVTTIHTNFAGRSGRGRIYAGGLNAAGQGSNNRFNDTMTEHVRELWGNIADSVFAATSWDLGVLSRVRNKTALDPQVFRRVKKFSGDALAGLSTNNRLDTQRRRAQQP